MINIIIGNTHSKAFFDEAANQERISFVKFMTTYFTFTDNKQKREILVIRKLKRPERCLYDLDTDIFMSGFIPKLKALIKKTNPDFEVKFHDRRTWPDFDLTIASQIQNETLMMGDKKPRDYQFEALKQIIKYRTGLLNIATGGGKSIIAGMILRLYQKHRCLFIFGELEHLSQMYTYLTEEIGFDKKEVGVVGAGAFQDNTRITLLSMLSYENLFNDFPTYKVVLGDESHQTLRSEVARKIICMCTSAPVHIGLSATNDLIENPVEQQELYGVAGPIIYRRDLDKQIEEGELAFTEVTFVRIPRREKIDIVGSWNDVYEKLEVPDLDNYKKHVVYDVLSSSDKITLPDDPKTIVELMIKNMENQGWELYKDQKEKKYVYRRFLHYGDESILYINNDARNQAICALAQEKNRPLVLFSKIRHGKILHEMLPNSVLIYGEKDTESRAKAKKSLIENTGEIILAGNIWDVGFDAPPIENLIMASLHVSKIRTTQKSGRVVRKSEQTGKINARVWDFWVSDNKLSESQNKKRYDIYKDIMRIPVNFQDTPPLMKQEKIKGS